ncbi:DUF3043 domain-containing protein [Dermabacteraceae bacterium P13115]
MSQSNAKQTEEVTGHPGGKGRRTPTRREAQQARRRPLVPEDRKEAKQRARKERAAAREREHRALMNGDESAMPLQHRGPQRRYVRNLVDARYNVGEYFMPIALVAMLIGFFAQIALIGSNPGAAVTLSNVLVIALWVGIALVVIDSLVVRRKVIAAVTEKFGTPERGIVTYGVTRALQIRRWRLPKPQVKHGEKVS